MTTDADFTIYVWDYLPLGVIDCDGVTFGTVNFESKLIILNELS